MKFAPDAFWSYVITAFLGSALFRLMGFLVSKAKRTKEIERARKIELARLQIRLDNGKQEGARSNDAVRLVAAMREHSQGETLAQQVYEIDTAELGRFWVWVGRLLGRIL